MKYQYRPPDSKHFAQGLRYSAENKKLVWDVSTGHDTLLVQTPFGQSAEKFIEAICSTLSEQNLPSGMFTEIMPDILVRLVSKGEKAREHGCSLVKEVCTYSIFACYQQEDVCSVYAPMNQAMNPATYNAPKDVHIDVSPVMKKEGIGLFRVKREVPSGYYRISFPKNIDKSYGNGFLQYQVGEFLLPITPMMLENGEVYVRSGEKPKIISTNQGLRLI